MIAQRPILQPHVLALMEWVFPSNLTHKVTGENTGKEKQPPPLRLASLTFAE